MRERQKQVAKLYIERKKTLRQCAEFLAVDLEKLMNIFFELNVPLSDEHSPQSRLALKLLREKNSHLLTRNQSARKTKKGAHHVLEASFV